MEMIERVARAMLRAEEWSSFFGEDDARKDASLANYPVKPDSSLDPQVND